MVDIFFTKHAISRMFERSISHDSVIKTINEGQVIKEYPEDKPYPSLIYLSIVDDIPLHVVCAIDKSTGDGIKYYVITVYIPSSKEWEDDYRTKRESK